MSINRCKFYFIGITASLGCLAAMLSGCRSLPDSTRLVSLEQPPIAEKKRQTASGQAAGVRLQRSEDGEKSGRGSVTAGPLLLETPSNEPPAKPSTPAPVYGLFEVVPELESEPTAAPPPDDPKSDSESLDSSELPLPQHEPDGSDAFEPHAIDFTTALALVAGQNPQVAFAQERIREAFANLDDAQALWLPSLRGGANYNKHEGAIQDVAGSLIDVSRGAVFAGFGSQAVGAGSPAVPGLQARFHLADAVFQPLIAERTAGAQQYAADAVLNNTLLDAAIAYLDLLAAVQARAIAEATLLNAQHLADQTEAFARAGQGTPADADRARTELSLRRNEVTRTEEAVQVASARLAQVLSLDATLDLRPAEPTITPIELVPADIGLHELVAAALCHRPELSEIRLLAEAAFERLRRERYAPLIPSVLLGLSYGGFGAGVGSDINTFPDRLDFDAAAFWEIRNLGVGERAARNQAHAQVHQAQFRQAQVMDLVARETAEAFAQVQARKKQIAVAEAGIKSAEDSYRRNTERIREGQGLPLEVLQSLQALDQSRREYLRVVTDYNAAQFRLQRALGWPMEQATLAGDRVQR
jgi:outer membrane protein TolC